MIGLRVMAALVLLTLAVLAWSGWQAAEFRQGCLEAGGVVRGPVCVDSTGRVLDRR